MVGWDGKVISLTNYLNTIVCNWKYTKRFYIYTPWIWIVKKGALEGEDGCRGLT